MGPIHAARVAHGRCGPCVKPNRVGWEPCSASSRCRCCGGEYIPRGIGSRKRRTLPTGNAPRTGKSSCKPAHTWRNTICTRRTANLSRELPDFAPLVFNSIAVASRLGETDRFQGLWKRLRETDSRFDRTWFETAYYHHGSGAQHSKSVFAARFQRWVDADFANFIGWLGHGGEEESHPDVSRGGANTPRAR